jgi:hypothetical protein
MTGKKERIVLWPDLFPRTRPPGAGEFYYLSWPSWERFADSFEAGIGAGSFGGGMGTGIRAERAKGAAPIMAKDLEDFGKALSPLTAASLFDRLLGVFSKESGEGERTAEIKRCITGEAGAKKEAGGMGAALAAPYVGLALWTMGELQKDQARLLVRRADAMGRAMLEDLASPDLEGKDPEARTLPGFFDEGHEGSAKISGIPRGKALCLLGYWLSMAKGLLSPGDLMWTPYFDFSELLEEKFEEKAPGLFAYENA